MATLSRAVFAQYDPEFDAMSLDEAYLVRAVNACLFCFCALRQCACLAQDITDVCVTRARLLQDAAAAAIAAGGPAPSLDGSNLSDVAAHVVQELRAKVTVATGGLTCSAGIACNPMLAKVSEHLACLSNCTRLQMLALLLQIASNINKPDGQFVLPSTREAVMSFLKDLPVRYACGTDHVTLGNHLVV
jgi:nucleotidyltransferase/DNA polymerase involved in DNA repair